MINSKKRKFKLVHENEFKNGAFFAMHSLWLHLGIFRRICTLLRMGAIWRALSCNHPAISVANGGWTPPPKWSSDRGIATKESNFQRLSSETQPSQKNHLSLSVIFSCMRKPIPASSPVGPAETHPNTIPLRGFIYGGRGVVTHLISIWNLWWNN